MIDPIQAAIAKAKNVGTPAIESARTQATSAISTTRSSIPQLPTEKDPELLAKQAEAKAQSLLAE